MVGWLKQDSFRGPGPHPIRAFYLDSRIANDGLFDCHDPLIVSPASIEPKVAATLRPSRWNGALLDQVHRYAGTETVAFLKVLAPDQHALTHGYSIAKVVAPQLVPWFGFGFGEGS